MPVLATWSGGEGGPTWSQLGELARNYGGVLSASGYSSGGSPSPVLVARFEGLSLQSPPLTEGSPSSFSAALTATAYMVPGTSVGFADVTESVPPPYVPPPMGSHP